MSREAARVSDRPFCPTWRNPQPTVSWGDPAGTQDLTSRVLAGPGLLWPLHAWLIRSPAGASSWCLSLTTSRSQLQGCAGPAREPRGVPEMVILLFVLSWVPDSAVALVAFGGPLVPLASPTCHPKALPHCPSWALSLSGNAQTRQPTSPGIGCVSRPCSWPSSDCGPAGQPSCSTCPAWACCWACPASTAAPPSGTAPRTAPH